MFHGFYLGTSVEGASFLDLTVDGLFPAPAQVGHCLLERQLREIDVLGTHNAAFTKVTPGAARPLAWPIRQLQQLCCCELAKSPG